MGQQYSNQLKEKIMTKLYSSPSNGLSSLSRETGIPISTIAGWKKKAHLEPAFKDNNLLPKNWSMSSKLEAVIKASSLKEEELGLWLRENGLQSEYINLWKEELLDMSKTEKNKYQDEYKRLQKRNKELESELKRKDKALAEASALLILKKKSRFDLGKRRGVISAEDRKEIISLINESILNGARKKESCKLLNISIRTLQRWESEGVIDKRTITKMGNTHNGLSEDEKNMILEVCCSSPFMNLTPYSIVPILAENGIYIASESTFYKSYVKLTY